jgi:hypothetical protein
MKLPIQAQPVTSKVSPVKALNRSVFSSQDSEEVCFTKYKQFVWCAKEIVALQNVYKTARKLNVPDCLPQLKMRS